MRKAKEGEKMRNVRNEVSGNVQKNAPEQRFSTGAVSATVWKNVGKSRVGDDVEYNTISLQRRYKDKSGVWQTANSFRINDLPRAILVLQKAYEHLVLREKEESAAIDEEIVI